MATLEELIARKVELEAEIATFDWPMTEIELLEWAKENHRIWLVAKNDFSNLEEKIKDIIIAIEELL